MKRRAEEMSLPGPDNYILLLIRLEKQRLELFTKREPVGEREPAAA